MRGHVGGCVRGVGESCWWYESGGESVGGVPWLCETRVRQAILLFIGGCTKDFKPNEFKCSGQKMRSKRVRRPGDGVAVHAQAQQEIQLLVQARLTELEISSR